MINRFNKYIQVQQLIITKGKININFYALITVNNNHLFINLYNKMVAGLTGQWLKF